jgi:glycosyltransferase involved in cell wall biosynthesis
VIEAPWETALKWCFFSPGFRSVDVLGGDTRTTGGAEAQVAYLAAALARLGHDVGLIYGDGAGGLSPTVIEGVTCLNASPSWRSPLSVPAFWRAMDLLSPDLLYARLPSDFLWLMGLYARTRTKARFMYALASPFHCDPWNAYDYNRWFHAPLHALGLWSAHVIAVQHDHQAQLIGSGLRPRVVSVPNLVQSVSDRARPFGGTVYDASWVALIRPEKGLERFLDLADALPGLRFAVAGGFDPLVGDDLRGRLEQRMRGLKNLSFLGPQRASRIRTLLEQSKVLVNTSPAEGFPNTMLEAWSVGTPVVSLAVDPGGVIEREQLGLVSGSDARLVADVSTLSGTETLNIRLGEKALAYVRTRHCLDAVYGALMRASPGIRPSSAADRLQKT